MNNQDLSLFIPIPLQSLQLDSIRSFDILINVKGKMVLYHSGGDRFTTAIRDQLIENRTETVYIRKKDREVYRKYLEDNLGSLLTDPSIDTVHKAEIAYTSVNSIAQSFFTDLHTKAFVKYKDAISSTMDFIMHEDEALQNLIRLTSYDFTTYTHSVNVGIFAIGLAKTIFQDDDSHDLKAIATGFFLHDIGKTAVPQAILNKRGPLTPDEWVVMKRHPEQGYQILEKMNALTEEAKVIVMEHHERHDGTGYPRGLSGDNIHIYSKICCIADVFEALTAMRPYKQPQSSYNALKIMKKEMYPEFDPEFFRQFVLLFSDIILMQQGLE